MDELTRPFVRLWSYIEREGGYPGQLLCGCIVVMAVIALFTWLSNKR